MARGACSAQSGTRTAEILSDSVTQVPRIEGPKYGETVFLHDNNPDSDLLQVLPLS
jgi:hypothetical protein